MGPSITQIERTGIRYRPEDVGMDGSRFTLVYEGECSDTFDAVDDEGTVPVPDGPGLGVECDREFVEENNTGSVHAYE